MLLLLCYLLIIGFWIDGNTLNLQLNQNEFSFFFKFANKTLFTFLDHSHFGQMFVKLSPIWNFVHWPSKLFIPPSMWTDKLLSFYTFLDIAESFCQTVNRVNFAAQLNLSIFSTELKRQINFREKCFGRNSSPSTKNLHFAIFNQSSKNDAHCLMKNSVFAFCLRYWLMC